MHAARLLAVGQVVYRFLGIVNVRAAVGVIRAIVATIVAIVIVMVQHVFCVLDHVFDERFRSTHAAAACQMIEVALHGSNRLPRQHQHQENQERLFHVEWVTRVVQGQLNKMARK